MSRVQRWILGAVMAFVPLCGAAFAAPGVLVIMAMGTDSCRHLPDWIDSYLILSPLFLVVGSLLGGIFFGLNKAWYWWASSFAGGVFLSIASVIGWFLLLGVIC